MLETRKPPVSTRTSRPDAPPRPAAPRASSAPAVTRPAAREAVVAGSVVGNTALGRAPEFTQPVTRPAPARPSRQGRSEMRLMGLATTCTAVVCGLLLLYLAAYAHVTRLGIDQADARAQLRQDRLRNEMLRAERDRLQSPQRVLAAATALGMTPRGATAVLYISPPRNGAGDGPGTNGRGDARGGADGERGNGGTTADSSAAPLSH